MTTPNVAWSYDPQLRLRGLGSVVLSTRTADWPDPAAALTALLQELTAAIDVVPYNGFAVCCRPEGRLGRPTFGDQLASGLRRSATSLREASFELKDGSRASVAAASVKEAEITGRMLEKWDGIVLLIPPVPDVDVAIDRAVEITRLARYIRRDEEDCIRVVAALDPTEALMIPEGSHDDPWRSLRLFSAGAALSRLQSSLYKRWRPR